MTEQLWPYRPPSRPVSAPPPLWTSTPETPGQLTIDRARIRSHLLGDGPLAPAAVDDVERLLLAVEELGSNALRHGRPPVRMTIAATGTGWVLVVSDAGVDRPPAPAIGRDAAQGGLGLYLIARIAQAHGWHADLDRKHVWARIDFFAAPTGAA